MDVAGVTELAVDNSGSVNEVADAEQIRGCPRFNKNFPFACHIHRQGEVGIAVSKKRRHS
jgi:hypothetical protein